MRGVAIVLNSGDPSCPCRHGNAAPLQTSKFKGFTSRVGSNTWRRFPAALQPPSRRLPRGLACRFDRSRDDAQTRTRLSWRGHSGALRPDIFRECPPSCETSQESMEPHPGAALLRLRHCRESRLVWAVWAFHGHFYPTHHLQDFWPRGISLTSFVPSFLMVFALTPGSIGAGLCSGIYWLG